MHRTQIQLTTEQARARPSVDLGKLSKRAIDVHGPDREPVTLQCKVEGSTGGFLPLRTASLCLT